MKLNTKTKYSCVGFASSAAALGLVAMAMVCPGMDGAFAADPTTHTGDMTVGFNVLEPQEGVELFTGNLNVSFTVNPYIEISQNPQDVAVTVANPDFNGQTQSASTPFAVRTNSSTGFDVYVTATNKLLQSADATNTAAISPIAASGTALASFANNTWGYAVTTAGGAVSSYKSINDTNKAYGQSGFSSTATNLSLNFGAKVDATLPVDTYSTQVTVSAVLSGAEVANIASYSNDSFVSEEDNEAYLSEESGVSYE